MIKGAIFDMDGTLVANSPVHIRAFEIFCDRYGVRGWKEKLGGAFGRGNDDIMRLGCPLSEARPKETPRILPLAPPLQPPQHHLSSAPPGFGIRPAVANISPKRISYGNF